MNTERFQARELERHYFLEATHSECQQFNRKYELTSIIPFFLPAICAISTVHEFGNHKYSFYSWQNDPVGSDSLFQDSLNAANRHLVPICTDRVITDSGLHHLCHAVTRIGSMALTRYYRMIMGTAKEFHRVVTRDSVSRVLSDDFGCGFPIYQDQITSEVWMSTLKYDPKYIGNTFEEQIDLMQKSILKLAICPPVGVFDLFNEVQVIDIAFWNGAAALHSIPDLYPSLKNYLDSIPEVKECPSSSSQSEESTLVQNPNGNRLTLYSNKMLGHLTKVLSILKLGTEKPDGVISSTESCETVQPPIITLTDQVEETPSLQKISEQLPPSIPTK